MASLDADQITVAVDATLTTPDPHGREATWIFVK